MVTRGRTAADLCCLFEVPAGCERGENTLREEKPVVPPSLQESCSGKAGDFGLMIKSGAEPPCPGGLARRDPLPRGVMEAFQCEPSSLPAPLVGGFEGGAFGRVPEWTFTEVKRSGPPARGGTSVARNR